MRKRHTHHQPSQSGNVLFIILIAVALFAALSYAVTQSSRGGGGDVSAEKNEMLAAQIVEYGNAIENAIMRMMLMGGCEDTQISFEHSPFDGSDTDYFNANSPNNFSCHVFHPEGGGVSNQEHQLLKTFPSDSYIRYVANSDLQYIGTYGCGDASCVDLYMLFVMTDSYGYSMCDATNVYLKDDDLIPLITANSINGTNRFTGTYSHVSFVSSYWSGKRSFCHNWSADNDRNFYVHVLLPR